MKHGTNVNEITKSLSNGDIVRLLGNGWKPRTRSLEIITEKNGKCKIEDHRSLNELSEMLAEFLKEEKDKL